MPTSTPSDCAVKEEVLKVNEYKRVALVNEAGARAFVVKSFSGHSAEDCRRNALHTYRSLQILRTRFSHVLCSPMPLGVDLDDCSVRMEYLFDLRSARQLCLAELPSQSAFFVACYELEQDMEHLGSIKGSVHLTPKTRQLIESGFPMRLGFKGDLYENLRLGQRGLMLADAETASLEPLGLSELVLYVFLTSAFRSIIRGRRVRAKLAKPVAFRYLSNTQSMELIEAALEFSSAGMQGVSAPLRAAKLRFAKRYLCRTLNSV